MSTPNKHDKKQPIQKRDTLSSVKFCRDVLFSSLTGVQRSYEVTSSSKMSRQSRFPSKDCQGTTEVYTSVGRASSVSPLNGHTIISESHSDTTSGRRGLVFRGLIFEIGDPSVSLHF